MREWGAETGRPLVFWQGLNPFGALLLNEVGPAWAARGFRVVAPAAPGLADSPPLDAPESYAPTRLAELVLSLADELRIETFAFVGWSWGASIGVHLGAAHADRLTALVLIDAGHTDVELEGTLAELEREVEVEQDSFSCETWDEFVAACRDRSRRWRPALEARFRAGMVERDGRIVAAWSPRAAAWAYWGVAKEPPSTARARLGATGLPVLLLLASDNDTAEAARSFASEVPHAELQEVAGRHDLFADAPEETAAVVADWLD